MARNGSGTYIQPKPDVVPGTVIESEWANDTIHDISQALTQSIAYDGQTVPIANLPMGGFHHTNVSNAVSLNQYATLGQVQSGQHIRIPSIVGVDNLIGTLPGGATAYTPGAFVSFFAVGANTGPMTLNYKGIGPKSLVTAEGLPLAGGEVEAGDFLIAYYDGAVFKFLSIVRSAVPPEIFQLRTTGQQRPADGTYDQMTIATPNSINIPAGTAWVIPPNADAPADAVKVEWLAQTIVLNFLATNFTTTIAADIDGNIIQFSGRVIGGPLRSAAVLGVVEHLGGTANKVITKPFIFGDDGYRGTDTSTLLTNAIISGGLVSGNAVSLLQLDISAGSIYMPGGSANTIDSPNVYQIAQQQNLPFRTLAGQNTLGAQILNAPVANYDPNGAGVVQILPNNGDTVVHRLYYLYGTFIWAYGQRIYTSVANALSFLEYDRTQYKASTFLADATLVAEIIAQKNTASLLNLTQAAIVAPGKINFSIGSPGGITEAPIDGTPYGRQNATWVSVLRALNPAIQGSASITGPAPNLNLIMNPYAAGTVGYTVWANLFKWFALEVTNPDDKAYLRSYNPADGTLRHTITYDLATGGINLDGQQVVTVTGTQDDATMTWDIALSKWVENTKLKSDPTTGLATIDGNVSQKSSAYAWGASFPAHDIGNQGAIATSNIDGSFFEAMNAYYDGVNWRYKTAGAAALTSLGATGFSYFSAPVGVANAIVAFTQRFASSNAGIAAGLWSNNGVGNASAQFQYVTQAQYDAGPKDTNTIYFIS